MWQAWGFYFYFYFTDVPNRWKAGIVFLIFSEFKLVFSPVLYIGLAFFFFLVKYIGLAYLPLNQHIAFKRVYLI